MLRNNLRNKNKICIEVESCWKMSVKRNVASGKNLVAFIQLGSP